ncbi:MAG: hypothetical protein M1834_006659 [Cirrosporium novae-zelandiae]|nr:MAG: hypothetical protein M1834_006659 [Cirrosporium novae-zelandiae]
MFDLLPNLLSSVVAIAFPIFASYKALRTSDPSQLTPWLMYWVVLSTALLVESWTAFILTWFAVTQTPRIKSKHTYAHHEQEIDDFISNAHDRAKAAGLQYIKQAIDFIKENVFGIQPQPSPPPTRHASYAQTLLSRFNLPTAGEGLAAPAGDFYGLLSSALAGAMGSGGSRDRQAEDLSASGTLVPSHITSDAEKMTYLSAQRERLRVLLSALDKEASDISVPQDREMEDDLDRRMHNISGEFRRRRSNDGLKKNRSEVDFESIEHPKESAKQGRTTSGGWMPWSWNANEEARSSGTDTDMNY